MILLITTIFIILLGSGLISLGIENYKQMRSSRQWIGWKYQASKINLFLYKIGL